MKITKPKSLQSILILGDADAPSGATVDREIVHGKKYDQVWLIDQLPLLRREKVIEYLREVWHDMKPNGALIVTAPSLEWAAQEIMTKDQPGLAVYWTIYGGGERKYNSGYTLLWLRAALHEAGFAVTQAERRKVMLNDQYAMELYVVARRREIGEAIE